MIDLQNEQLLSLREVPAWLAERNIKPRGGPVTKRCVQGWVQRGILEVTPKHLFGGTRYTSVEALQRMIERSLEGPKAEEPSTPRRKAKKREKASAAAGKELDAVGW